MDEIGNQSGKSGHMKSQQLDNARKLRGIYFIGFEDKEFKEIIRNERRKLETPMDPTMPCKISKNSQHGVARGESNEITAHTVFIVSLGKRRRH